LEIAWRKSLRIKSSGSSKGNPDRSDHSDEFDLDERGLPLDWDDDEELPCRLELGDVNDGVIGCDKVSSSNIEASDLFSCSSSSKKLKLERDGDDEGRTLVSLASSGSDSGAGANEGLGSLSGMSPGKDKSGIASSRRLKAENS